MWSKSTIEPKKWRISTKCKHRTTTNDQENHCELKLASRKEWSSFRSVLQCEHLTWCECCFRDFGFSVCVRYCSEFCLRLMSRCSVTASLASLSWAGIVNERKAGKGCCQCVAQYPRTTKNTNGIFLVPRFIRLLNRIPITFHFSNFLTHIMPIMPWNKQIENCNVSCTKKMVDVCVCCGNNVNRTTGHKLLRNFPLSQPYSSA